MHYFKTNINPSLSHMLIKRFSVVIIFALASFGAHGQSIIGPGVVTAGSSQIYQVTDVDYAGWDFSAPGGTITNSNRTCNDGNPEFVAQQQQKKKSGGVIANNAPPICTSYTYTVHITWGSGVSGSVNFRNNGITLYNLGVQICPASVPAPNPSSFTITNCGSISISYSGAPPSGTGWFWQTSPTGTSLTNSTSSMSSATSGNFYLRAVSCAVWSTAIPVNGNGGLVNVQTVPTLSVSNNASTFCSGQSTNISLSNPNGVSGTTYSWTTSSSNISGASSVSNTSATTIAQTLTTPTSNSSGSVTYSITASAGGCTSGVTTASVTVNPVPTLSVVSNVPVFCSGQSTNISLSNPNGTSGTTYSWTTSGSNVSGTSSVSNTSATTISQALSTPSSGSSGWATYTVTATAGSCTSGASSATVTINPVPTLSVTNNAASFCSGSSTSISLSNPNGVSGTTYSWTVSPSNATGASAVSNTSSTSIAQTLSSASGNTSGTVTYNITASASGCTSGTNSPVVTVKPNPTLSVTNNASSICPGQSTSITISNPNSVTGTTYSWTVSPSNATGASAASNTSTTSVVQSLATVSTGSSGTVTYGFSASANGCGTTTTNTSVTVKALPLIFVTNDATTICSAQSTNIVLSTTNGLSGTTYSWTVTPTNVSGATAVSNTSSTSITQTLGNAGNIAGNVVYNITPSTAGCTGASTNTTVNVNPIPTAAITSQSPICSGTMTNLMVTNPNSVSGTVLNWTASPTNISGSASGSGSNGAVIAQTLVSVTGNTGSVVYAVTPSAGGCNGTPATTTVNVNPTPTAAAAVGQSTLCSGNSTTITLSNPNSVSGTTYSIAQTSTNAMIPDFTDAVGTTFTGNYYNVDGVNAGTGVYTVTPHTALCTGIPVTATITVSPALVAPTQQTFLAYGQTSAILKVTVPPTGQARWYADNVTSTVLSTNSTYAITADGNNNFPTYFVSLKDLGSACETSRTALTATYVSLISPASVTQEIVRVAGKTVEEDIIPLSTTTQKGVTVSYIDGLSRPTQVLALSATPGSKDMVQPVEYDSYGRTAKDYLPYSATTNGAFQNSYVANQASFYNNSGDKVADDANPYALAVYEQSPLGRTLEQGNVGAAWQPGTQHTKQATYSFNTGSSNSESEEVRLFASDGSSSGFFAANKLSRMQTRDENGNFDIVFKNGTGKTISRKQQVNGSSYLQTYYIYDDFNRLKYILPPAGLVALKNNSWTLTQTIIDDHLHQFVYDNRGRLVQKKTPGQAWSYLVYDDLNRLVLTQDGNLRPLNKWAFVKYDRQGRMVMSGLYTNATQTDRASVQSIVSSQYATGVYYESKGSAIYGYTNQSFPTVNADNGALEILSVGYFDNYDFDNNGTADYTYDNTHLAGLPASTCASSRGYATGSRKLILGTSNWLISAVFYDSFGRVIQTQSNNHLNLVVEDKSSVAYDFEGKILRKRSLHKGSALVDLTNEFEYDATGRLLKTYQRGSDISDPVTWTSAVNVSVSGNSITSTGLTAPWGISGAASSDLIPASADGFMESTVDETTTDRIFGLAITNPDAGMVSIDYAFYLQSYTLRVYEKGVSKFFFGTVTRGDRLRVERVNGIIYYKVNGQVIYTSATSSATALMVDASIATNGGTVKDVRISRGRMLINELVYNELSQVTDKKIYTGDSRNLLLQNVDYRFNIRGWLTSINNAQLTNDGVTNNDTGDYFGMELNYNTDAGTSNNLYFNGNVSAVKWRNPNTGTGASGQRSYTYNYDGTDRLLGATFKKYGVAAWDQELNTLNESMTYDNNGNILTLQRNQNLHGLSGITVTSTAQQIDNLNYTYLNNANQLSKVDDSATPAGGFNNGANSGDDYTYDIHGNATSDQNKGISSITYNALGKAQQITFTDGRTITYTYDASGAKLTMKTALSGTTQSQTDYAGGILYENTRLAYVPAPGGRMIRNGANLIANGDCSSTAGFTSYFGTGPVTLSAVTLNGENYVKIVSLQNGGNSGAQPIGGGSFPVTPGERYSFRVKGYVSGSGVPLRLKVYTNSGVYMNSPDFFNTTTEKWITTEFTIQPGTTYVQFGLLWSSTVPGDEAYINKIELVKLSDEYQFSIADHQGNTRVLFSSITPPPVVTTATFELDANDQSPQFANAARTTYSAANHTSGGSKVSRMNQLNPVGPSLSKKVYPGDKVDLEVWSYYESTSGYGTSNASLASIITAVSGALINGGPDAGGLKAAGVNNALNGFGIGANQGDTQPAAFLNYILFDTNYKVMDAGWQVISSGSFSQHQVTLPQITVKEPGYIFAYLSYEDQSNNYVYFDDFKVTITPTNIIQSNEYYPFGLQTAQSWTRENSSNNFLYNQGSEINTTSGFYDLPYRNYDASLGRFFQVDPLAKRTHHLSPYHYAMNNPIGRNDPSGLYPVKPGNLSPETQNGGDGGNGLAAYGTEEGGGQGGGWSEDSESEGGTGSDEENDEKEKQFRVMSAQINEDGSVTMTLEAKDGNQYTVTVSGEDGAYGIDTSGDDYTALQNSNGSFDISQGMLLASAEVQSQTDTRTYIIGGADLNSGGLSSTTQTIISATNGTGYNVTLANAGILTNRIVADITAAYSPGQNVQIYGYSKGGRIAMQVATALKESNIPVSILVTVDAADAWMSNYIDRTVSSNVSVNYNFFQTTPSSIKSHGDYNTGTGLIFNYNLTSPNMTHGNIDEAVMNTAIFLLKH
ncbi:hypothetical protein WSM22_47010 [Cytophagales bacterium WSM2-2]|nr:hypothetical protein WSM22_47010 [Cytophagales bacterium WSM2-2]